MMEKWNDLTADTVNEWVIGWNKPLPCQVCVGKFAISRLLASQDVRNVGVGAVDLVAQVDKIIKQSIGLENELLGSLV